MHNFYKLIQNKFNRNAKKIKIFDNISTELSLRLLNRLDYIKFKPQTILDIGSGINSNVKTLLIKYPKAFIFSVDFAINMLKNYRFIKNCIFNLFKKKPLYICADALFLPFKSNSFDLICANMLLPFIQLEDHKTLFIQIQKLLKKDGYLILNGLGLDTLKQIRELGFSSYNFLDMHLVADLLVSVGYKDTVIDVEYLDIEYNSLDELIMDLRLIGNGANCQLYNNISKKQYNNFINIKNKPSTFKITLEIFYVFALKGSNHNLTTIQFFPRKN